MGFGSYSEDAHHAITSQRKSVPREQVFKQKKCHSLMNPYGVRLRECRDSDTHPNSVGIVFALDVTGSMGAIPDQLARRELPSFMRMLFEYGMPDPQVMFTAVGDATCDQAPLQVGQFESEAELMDQWLTWSYLEGGGGGQSTESYELALYFIARHTALDCWEKRSKRGYLFMTGDENPYPQVSKQQVRSLIGDELDGDISVARIVEELQVCYEPFFLIPDKNRRRRCERTWRDLMGDHVICLAAPEDTCHAAAALVGLCEGALTNLDVVSKRLRETGLDRQRAGRILTALTPFAELLAQGVVGPNSSTGPTANAPAFPPANVQSGLLR